MKVSFRFAVDFCGNLYNKLDITSDHHEMILKWYNKHGGYIAESNDMENVMFEFVGIDVIECSYELSEELYKLYLKTDDFYINHRMIADPDDDGNYPVKIDGKEWLIHGSILHG
jgi:hypothetical protein